MSAAVVLAGCTSTTTGTPHPGDSPGEQPAPAQPVAAVAGDQLPGIALPVAAVEEIIGTPLPELGSPPQRRIVYLGPPTLDKPDCAPMWVVGQKTAYDGTGWLDAWGVVSASAPLAPVPQRFSQAQSSYAEFLATYPSASVAKSALQVFAAALQKCDMDQFNVDGMSWITDKVAYSQPTIVAASLFELDGRNEGCAVRVGAKANVTVELHLCGDKDTIGPQADTAITTALARVPA
ncbi:hypothetical protein B1R94_27665 [Mycolicibacterium litorale]|nr:hypothetical protein B1R94_27665 [Mycolicibacterium litorale]